MITDTYFGKHTFADRVQNILDEVSAKLHFSLGKPLFRGHVYDESRLGSVVFSGSWKGNPAVLKIQGLELPREEKDMMDAFEAQKNGKKIRTPNVYRYAPWDDQKKYSYILMEHISAPTILPSANATDEHIKNFFTFLEELKANVITTPWLTPDTYQQSSARFMRHRLSKWVGIAKDRGHYNAELLNKKIQSFNEVLDKIHPEIPMEFTHAHLTGREVRYDEKHEQYIILANLYWDFRPTWYPVVFALWSQLKDPASDCTTLTRAQQTTESWKKQLLANTKEKKASLYFDTLLLERLLGALIIDLETQNYMHDSKKEALYDTISALYDETLTSMHIK